MPKQLIHTRQDGRKFVVSIPDDAPESHARFGMVVGPPEDLASFLHLPEEVSIRLHNELFARRILTRKDAQSRLSEVRAAILSALGSTVEEVVAAYSGIDNGGVNVNSTS